MLQIIIRLPRTERYPTPTGFPRFLADASVVVVENVSGIPTRFTPAPPAVLLTKTLLSKILLGKMLLNWISLNRVLLNKTLLNKVLLNMVLLSGILLSKTLLRKIMLSKILLNKQLPGKICLLYNFDGAERPSRDKSRGQRRLHNNK